MNDTQLPRTALTRAQVRAIDERAIRDLAIPGIVLMENAGSRVASEIHGLWKETPDARVVVLAGSGNNGGDGFVIARHLSIAGSPGRVFWCGDRSRLTPDAATNLEILRRMKVDVVEAPDAPRMASAIADLRESDFVVDALVGTGFEGSMREPLASLIHGLNKARKKQVFAVDIPSGLDCDRGEPSNATVRADLTFTFVAMKVGFLSPTAGDYTGKVVVVPIGAPVFPLPDVGRST